MQAACVLLDDDVPTRLHWPRHAELRVNNMHYRPYGRSGALKLGANARDEPASIGTLCFHGRNALSLSAADNRPFCLVLQVRHAAAGRVFRPRGIVCPRTQCAVAVRSRQPPLRPRAAGAACCCGQGSSGHGVSIGPRACHTGGSYRPPPPPPPPPRRIAGTACCCGAFHQP